MRRQVIIEDHVLPQLLTSAIEAYEVTHKAHERGRASEKLETFGLLWGYALPARDNVPVRLVAVVATVETSALRTSLWVQPDPASIRMKRDFFAEYWPQLELIGTFHSHPYDSLAEVTANKCWRASEGDKDYWPHFHESTCPDMHNLAHLIVTITALSRKGTAAPERLPGVEYSSGYAVSAGKRKFWIKGYTTSLGEYFVDGETDDGEFDLIKNRTYNLYEDADVLLEIPSLEARFRHEVLRK